VPAEGSTPRSGHGTLVPLADHARLVLCRYPPPASSHRPNPEPAVVSAASAVAVLAGRINALPTFRPGNYNCPDDDGSALLLNFGASDGKAVMLEANLSGCASITDGRTVRELTPSVEGRLTALAPAGSDMR
jgi:hypothetical protein